MLSLESTEWAKLQHAYGSASDIPSLLQQLEAFNASDENAGPWSSIWSALAHQGDIYPASFAAVPHVVRILSSAPTEASAEYFQFPAWVEICRQRKNISVPPDLAIAYFESLSKLPELVGAAAAHEWNSSFLTAAMSAIAAAKGSAVVAEAVLELNPSMAKDFLEWFHAR